MNSKKGPIMKSLLALVVLALTFGVALIVHFPNPRPQQLTATRVNLVTSTSAMSSGRAPSANISPDGHGWVLTTAGLELTSNNGDTFNTVQSPIPTPNIHDVAVNGAQIRIATVINGSPVVELSSDFGATWKVVSLPEGSGNAGVAQFVTESRMVVGMLVTDVTSSNFSSGEWYSTLDGGLMWVHHEIPAAGVVTSANGNLWLVAGPQFKTLYRSSNHGAAWTKVTTPDSASTNAEAFSMPGEFINGDMVLVATEMNLATASKFGVTIYLSSDLGVTWKVSTHTAFAGQINSGEAITSGIYGNSIWLGSAIDQKILIISSDGTMTSTTSTNAIFPGGGIYSLTPTRNSTAWVTAMSDQCPSGKTSCTEVGALLKTVDSGKSWSIVNLTPARTS